MFRVRPSADFSFKKAPLMNKSIFVLAIASGTLCAIFALPLAAAVIPPIGLSPGSPYQLIFVTADTTQATSSSIASYNSFVQAEALGSSSSVVQSATWSAIVSTANIGPSSAPVNAFSDGTYPVYNTAGQLVEPAGGGGLYGPPAVLLQNLPDYDQNGNLDISTAWSGTVVFGRQIVGSTYLMGQAAPIVGVDNLNSDVGQWIDNFATEPNTNSYPIYALSAPIMSPVPEPASLVLFAIGAIALFAAARNRARTATHIP